MTTFSRWKIHLLFVFIRSITCGGLCELDGGLNIALHSQSRYADHGWVAGSEITTAGILAALRRHSHVARAEVFAPFAYSGISEVDWDVLLIEGWTGPIDRVIHSLRSERRLRCPDKPPLLVFHWCLDTFPDLETITALDVDGFLTNSRTLLPLLGGIAPTLYLPLAADPGAMTPVAPKEEYAHPVVYLGQASLTKHRLLEVLSELLPLGLAIYGLGWDRFGEDERFAPLLEAWKGVLPKDDIASLYSSASVVVGTTESEQRSLGMVNNRVFEALSVGKACFLSDVFPALDQLKLPLFVHSAPGDAFKHASALLNNATARNQASLAGRLAVLKAHTYDHRVATLLPWLAETFGVRWPRGGTVDVPQPNPLSPPRRRPNLPKVLLLYGAGSGVSEEEDESSDPLLQLGLLQGLALALGPCCDFTVRRVGQVEVRGAGLGLAALVEESLTNYALVLARARWGSPLRRAVSNAAQRISAATWESESSSSRRAARWKARAKIGLLLRSAPVVTQSESSDPSVSVCHSSSEYFPFARDLLAFDLVVHDDPVLVCCAGQAINTLSTVQENEHLELCAHRPNALRGLSLDVAALREGSQGWHDDVQEKRRWDLVALAATTRALLTVGPSGKVVQGVAERLCAHSDRQETVAFLVASPIRPRPNDEAWPSEALALKRLRSCGVDVVGGLLDRPERIPAMLRSAGKVEVFSSSTVQSPPPATPRDVSTTMGSPLLLASVGSSDEAVLLLAALAVGAEVVVGGDKALMALLEGEIDKTARLGRAPLADFDVSSSNSSPAGTLPETAAYTEAYVGSTAVGAMSASPFARRLLAAVDGTLVAPFASAGVEILEPADTGVISLAACRAAREQGFTDVAVRVSVRVRNFRIPDDGTWCLRVDGREVACFGDARFAVDASLPLLPSLGGGASGVAEVQGDEGVSWCTEGGVVQLEAVLRGGALEEPTAVRTSPVIRLLVVG